MANIDREPDLFSIFEIAKMTNRSPSTIRRHDALLKPLRTSTGMRLYPRDAVDRALAMLAERTAA